MAQSVQEILYDLNSKRVREMRADIRKRFNTAQTFEDEEKQMERLALAARKSCEDHLEDLRKVYPNPLRTEYKITSERAIAPRNYMTYGSIYGSPALSCAEMASP